MTDEQCGVIESEQLYLGALMVNPARMMDVRISEAHFLSDRHRTVFRCLQDLSQRDETIDVLSVADEVQAQHGHSWAGDLSEWALRAFSPTFFDSTQKIIAKEYRKREVRRIASDLVGNFDADAAIQSLMDLNVIQRNHTHTLGEALSAAVENVETLYRSGKLAGITTGLKDLDEAIGGFQDSDLYVIGGRPAMGKTAVMCNFMLSSGVAGAFFSTEQPMDQIGLRAISIEGRVSSRRLRSGRLEDNDFPLLISAAQKASGKKIFIHDKPGITINEIFREARRLKYNHDIKIIFVDYIQRIRAEAENRRLEVAKVVEGLKTLARELQVPVVALAQVSREVERRANKRPHMGDLLESGVIEQEADVVALLYRDEVYNEDSPDKGILEFIIDKNRHGPVGSLDFAWIGDNMRVADLAPYPQEHTA